MGNINVARVLLGGLVAGLLLNVLDFILNQFVLAEQWAEFMAEAGVEAPTAAQMTLFLVVVFLYGIALVWVYAAIRPRFGPGPKTAVLAGLTVWVVAWLLVGATLVTGGMYPPDLMVPTIVWGFFQLPIAAVTGAWFYRENEAA